MLLSMTVGFSSAGIAAAPSAKADLPKCHKELKRADGSKVTAYFSAPDCQIIKHAKKGEMVELL